MRGTAGDAAPWTTRADPEITLRHMAEAGIDRTVIPIDNPDYGKPNQRMPASRAGESYAPVYIGFLPGTQVTSPG